MSISADPPRSDPFATGFLTRLPEPPRKVVIVRALRIGDCICATPAFRALRAALPDAGISLIGLPFVRELVERSSHLNRFFEHPGFPGMAEQFFEARKATRFLARMQEEKFDLAIQFHGSGVYSNPFALLLGARHTVGFVRDGDPPGRLDAALPFPPPGIHEVRRALALTTFLGAPPKEEETEFPVTPADEAEADGLLAGAEPPLIGLHPAARDAPKRWPLAKFAEAARELRRRYGGSVVIVGGPGEREAGEALAREIGGVCCNLAGRTLLGGLGAVLARLAVLVTNDSGPAHVAYAVGTPTVTLFAVTDPAVWGPPESGPFRVVTPPVEAKGENRIEAVTVGSVVEAAEAVLRRS